MHALLFVWHLSDETSSTVNCFFASMHNFDKKCAIDILKIFRVPLSILLLTHTSRSPVSYCYADTLSDPSEEDCMKENSGLALFPRKKFSSSPHDTNNGIHEPDILCMMTFRYCSIIYFCTKYKMRGVTGWCVQKKIRFQGAQCELKHVFIKYHPHIIPN